MTPNNPRSQAQKPYKLGVISSYVPKRCGVATFANNLLLNLLDLEPKTDVWIVAAEEDESYDYGPVVKTTVDVHKRATYAKAAAMLKRYSPDAILLQHEFGLYGGERSKYVANGVDHDDPTGSYLIDLIKPQSQPIVTTLHTVLKDLDPMRAKALGRVIDLSAWVVVMSELSKKIISRQFPSAKAKVVVIPHGVMERTKIEKKSVTLKRLKLQPGKFYLTVTGLMTPNKKIETIISALPGIITNHPEVHLLVVGQTHPQILKRQGDVYRDGLKKLARELKVTSHVTFVNKYMPADTLLDYLAVTDVYLTIHSDPHQAASGTLANAVGNGLVSISTPYAYAKEILAKNRGILVPFDNSKAISLAINRLIEDKALYKQIQRNAREFGRHMTWPRVAQAYWQLIKTTNNERS